MPQSLKSMPRYITLYSTTSPDHSGSVTFVVRPSTTSLRHATLMTRSLPSTEDMWRFATFPDDPDRRGRPFPICPFTIATAFLLRHHYDEPRATTFTLRAHTFFGKHTFCHVLFKRFKMNLSILGPPMCCQELVGSLRFSYDALHVPKFAQIVAERVAGQNV